MVYYIYRYKGFYRKYIIVMKIMNENIICSDIRICNHALLFVVTNNAFKFLVV